MFEMATRNELTSLGFSNIAPLKPTIRGERERSVTYLNRGSVNVTYKTMQESTPKRTHDRIVIN